MPSPRRTAHIARSLLILADEVERTNVADECTAEELKEAWALLEIVFAILPTRLRQRAAEIEGR